MIPEVERFEQIGWLELIDRPTRRRHLVTFRPFRALWNSARCEPFLVNAGQRARERCTDSHASCTESNATAAASVPSLRFSVPCRWNFARPK